MRKKLILVILFTGLIPVASVAYLFSIEPLEDKITQKIPNERPGEKQYCFDFAGALPFELVNRINREGAGLRNAFDIDFVVVIVPSLQGDDVVAYSADLFSDWKIGKSTQGKKGILILISMADERIKIEVGYDLEHIYTDLYIGQVEREMLGEFLEQADWERGFLATMENFVERTYRMYKKGDDTREVFERIEEDYYSGGAGATTRFDFGGALKKPLPQTSQELKEYFGAQPTPQQAHQRYMEFNARNMSDYTVDLFSEDSQIFFSHWRTSSGQRRSEAQAEDGLARTVKQKGRFAVVMSGSETSINDFICQCPYFFVRTGKGWQIDINAMGRSLIMGGPTWHFLSMGHPYMFAFEDYVIKTNRYYPLDGQKAFLGLTYSLWDKGQGGFKITPEWNSPAKKAGIKDKDILISIDGIKITEPYQDWEMMGNYNPGDVVEVAVKRNGKKKKIRVKLEEPRSYTDQFPYKRREGESWIGLYLGYSQPYERKIEDVQLSVLYVVENSPAEKAGFKARDLIYYVPGSRDRHVGIFDYNQLLKRHKPSDRVKFKVLRDLKERKKIIVEIGSYSQDKEGF